MKEYYARPEKDRVIVKPDGDVLLYAFEKYTLGMWQHLKTPKQRRHLYSSLTLLYNVYNYMGGGGLTERNRRETKTAAS